MVSSMVGKDDGRLLGSDDGKDDKVSKVGDSENSTEGLRLGLSVTLSRLFVGVNDSMTRAF